MADWSAECVFLAFKNNIAVFVKATIVISYSAAWKIFRTFYLGALFLYVARFEFAVSFSAIHTEVFFREYLT